MAKFVFKPKLYINAKDYKDMIAHCPTFAAGYEVVLKDEQLENVATIPSIFNVEPMPVATWRDKPPLL